MDIYELVITFWNVNNEGKGLNNNNKRLWERGTERYREVQRGTREVQERYKRGTREVQVISQKLLK